MWEELWPGRAQPPVSPSWQCWLGTKCLCSLEWRDLGPNVCGMLLNHKNQYPAWGMAFAGIFFFFQMSEPENLCVCTHVLLPLSTVSPKRQFPFLTNSASLPCLGRHHSSKQHCKIWLPTSTLVYLWGEEHPSDEHSCVFSHREGPRAESS